MESTDFYDFCHGNAYTTRLKHDEEKNTPAAVLGVDF